MVQNPSSPEPDVVLIGAGIMSATLGVILKELQPDLKIEIFERLDQVAAESTNAWNNAGTGHSAFCELNYTPLLKDGSIDTRKAVNIAENFEMSLQFWAYLIQQDYLKSPHSFIRPVPHMSFVWGNDNVKFLKKRYDALQKYPMFKGMLYSEDREQLQAWMPLVMEGRNKSEKVAATRMEHGTDVNFGELTRQLVNHLLTLPGVTLNLNHEVLKLRRKKDYRWKIKVKNTISGEKRKLKSNFIFIGAGGGSLPLLLDSGILEGKGFGGFPVSGQWLRCTNEEVIEKHSAKVYGKAAVGSPPMSVPHLDTRIINGKKELLFGPFAGFSTKFLKYGSYLDLPLSIKGNNLRPLVSAGLSNIPLTKYLIAQVRQSPEDRLKALREYYPEAKMEDWKLEIAGQRVQVIKKDPELGGVLEFGTEVVSSSDGSLTALLGASPGASTAVAVMLNVIQKSFKDHMSSADWQAKLQKMIPSFGKSLISSPDLYHHIKEYTREVLTIDATEEVSI